MKTFSIWSELNSMGFAVKVNDKDYDKAVHLALEGWHKWNDPEEYPEYEAYGYAEPSMELLDEAGIQYEIIDIEDDDEPFPLGAVFH